METGHPFSSTAHPALASSRFLGFFDECGDHSLTKIDPDFPLFVLALAVVERTAYRDVQPKRNNIVGNQIADLCAYPCARHILNPSRANPPYEVVRKKLYQKGGVSGWKLFP
jgi:hypothetical protein